MPQVLKKHRPARASHSSYATQPWRCVHLPDWSEIDAYVEASGKWETIATIPRSSGTSPESLAELVTNIVNDYQQHNHLLHAAMQALEEVVTKGWTFTSEQMAEKTLARLKKIGI